VTYNIGFAVLDQQSEIALDIQSSIERAAHHYTDINLIVLNNRHCDQTATQNAEQFQAWGVDLVMLFHRNAQLVSELRALLFPIPVISIDVQVPLVTYFGANERHCGMLAADALVEYADRYWGGTVDHVIALMDDAAVGIIENRVDHTLKPMVNALRDVPVVSKLWCPHDFKAVKRKLAQYLNKLDVNQRLAIVGFDPMMSTAMIDIAHCVKQEVVLVSHGADTKIRRALAHESPLIAATYADPNQYGTNLLQLAYQKLSGGHVNNHNYIDVQLLRSAYA
jgi:ABC-type sugar transport system substrate-binding protein